MTDSSRPERTWGLFRRPQPPAGQSAVTLIEWMRPGSHWTYTSIGRQQTTQSSM